MRNLYVRTVFFVSDTPRAIEFYRTTLGFSLDWTHEERGRPYVVQVSLFGMEVILNQAEGDEQDRPGRGRVFVGLGDDEVEEFLQHLERNNVPTDYTHWGAPTLVVTDQDKNEFYFWVPAKFHATLETKYKR